MFRLGELPPFTDLDRLQDHNPMGVIFTQWVFIHCKLPQVTDLDRWQNHWFTIFNSRGISPLRHSTSPWLGSLTKSPIHIFNSWVYYLLRIASSQWLGPMTESTIHYFQLKRCTSLSTFLKSLTWIDSIIADTQFSIQGVFLFSNFPHKNDLDRWQNQRSTFVKSVGVFLLVDMHQVTNLDRWQNHRFTIFNLRGVYLSRQLTSHWLGSMI